MMQGKQQQRAIPIKHAKTTQKMAKKTSNARKTTDNLQNYKKQIFDINEDYKIQQTICQKELEIIQTFKYS